MSFDNLVYIDLAEKTAARVEMQQKTNEGIVKDGYTPKPKIIKKADDDQKAADKSAAEPLVDGQNDSNTIVIDFNKKPGKDMATPDKAATIPESQKTPRTERRRQSEVVNGPVNADFGTADPSSSNNSQQKKKESNSKLTQ